MVGLTAHLTTLIFILQMTTFLSDYLNSGGEVITRLFNDNNQFAIKSEFYGESQPTEAVQSQINNELTNKIQSIFSESPANSSGCYTFRAAKCDCGECEANVLSMITSFDLWL